MKYITPISVVSLAVLARFLFQPDWPSALVLCLLAVLFWLQDSPKDVVAGDADNLRIAKIENDLKSLRSALALKNMSQ